MRDTFCLKIAPLQGMMRFGKKEKFNPRFIRPFEIFERIEMIAYKLALSLDLASVNNVFHVSMLKKFVSDPSHVLTQEPIGAHEDLTYEKKSVIIVDKQDKMLRSKVLRNKVIPIVKVL